MAPAGSRPPVLVCEDVKDPAGNAAALRALLLPILRDGAVLAAMRASARSLPGASAASTVAQWLMDAGANSR